MTLVATRHLFDCERVPAPPQDPNRPFNAIDVKEVPRNYFWRNERLNQNLTLAGELA